ncbi:MAG: RagB/SusD family nutrient uptake outer membrane protein [Bacteroidales bacterium]|nr:RagB/SusD family nutrient uptake outer membrane protein [Bacteroidales bacterium]
MKKIFAILSLVAAVAACDLEKFPSDSISADSMSDPANAAVVTDGTYAMFKAILMYDGMVYSANSYVRHFFQMAEFRGDNITLCAYTPDPLNSAIIYKDVSTEGNTGYYWWIAYKILFSANTMIEAIPEGTSQMSDHILGENYFIRAVTHLHLLQLYSFPYSHGRDNLGVVLRNSTDCSETKRATVGECYDQVEQDLIKAASLMQGGARRGNNGYINYEAAMGLLSRVQLYMEKWDDCIATVNTVLGGADPASKLDPSYVNLFQNSKTSPEVLWCVAMIPSDWTDQKGSMGSMFYSYDSATGGIAGPGAGGWGEIYYSQPLIDLFNRYPEDKRWTTMAEAYQHDGTRKMAYWPIKDNVADYRLMHVDESPVVNGDGFLTDVKGPDGASYSVERRIVNTYPEYHINYGGEDVKIGFMDKCYLNHTFPTVYMKKFANMEGASNVLNSPIIIRWAEVILNRAEAYAHKGDTPNALKDVKVIRERAGLTGDAEMTAANMAERGYADILDLVLDERRMELCFEGHRPMDQFRNKKDLDRRYGGSQPWGIVKWNDSRIPFQIPYGEVSVSGIPQNQR